MTDEQGNRLQKLAFPLDQISGQCESAFAGPMRDEGRILTVMVAIGAARVRIGDPFRLREALDNILTRPAPGEARVGIAFSGREGRPLVIEVTGVAAPVPRVGELVAAMGGTLTFAPPATLRLTLPFDSADAESIEPAEPAARREARPFGGLRLLIADDSHTNLMVMREMLASTGAQITTAGDGQQVLDLWRSRPLDMLLLDIAMPFVDGLAALRIIRAEEDRTNSPHIPAVAVTANVMAHQVDEYILGGFDTHIAKPFRRSELIETIAALAPADRLAARG